ncbi:exodeoxyribonuclease VII large subunit [Sphingomonas sp. PR090111-T3T-6A]|uniref:exodeoxyribonuclease VII large subunit n=1 Tax=Sphingomonas sp. PR090111-T3T-6A TaxID=685778 RepID=UPI00036BD850|nr:exodeoxyribonuclease VII large subunit [Sphingomonas sp. PR090111-T3T-6A]
MVTPSDYPTGALLADETPGDNAPALSVSELSGALKRTVEDRFGHVRVRGEISGFKRHVSGHCYMALKDDKAVIDGVIWKGQAASLRFRPEDGIEVIATGKLTTYPGRSKYQIIIDRMELAGQGALMALLDKRRRMLAAEGLFDEERKVALPFVPRVIGVVTSPTGAVIRDILHRLADRFPSQVLVWGVPVQGEGAAEKVAAAVNGFSAMAEGGPLPRPDLVIVARGGGSIEDLWAFNEEVVVRAVAACTIPIISAVGHETDTTLCDFAADRRAPTPTAAAEMAVPVRAELLGYLDTLGHRSMRCARRYHERGAERFTATARRLPTPDTLLGPQRQKLDDLGERLPRALSQRLAVARGDLAHAAGALRPRLLGQRVERERATLDRLGRDLARSAAVPVADAARKLDRMPLRPTLVTGRLAEARAKLDALWRVAQSLNPDLVLRRGYARVEAEGHVVDSAAKAEAVGAMRLIFADGGVNVVATDAPPPSRPKPRPPRDPSLQPQLF